MNNTRGLLVVVSGPSGVGKGTIMRPFMERNQNVKYSVSATTRAPREGEIDGVNYHFVTKEQFENLIENDEMLEYARYSRNYYGTPRSYVEEKLSEGKNVILEIEIQGAMKIKEKIPEAVLIFVTPPSVDELRRRLEGRGTETQEVIESRLSRAAEEAEGMEDYDYLLVNDDLEECVNELHRIISSERCKTQRNTEFINRIQEESRGLMKGDL